MTVDAKSLIEALGEDELRKLIADVVGEGARKLADEPTLADTAKALAAATTAADTFWLLYCGALVFMMQAGFAMLEAGSLREKNVKNIMLKNVLDPCVGAIAFWAFGYGISYGNASGTTDITYIGNSFFFLGGGFDAGVDSPSFHGWFFQFAFAATAATIVSGAVAERCQMLAYILYSTFLTAFVYPIVVHTIWSSEGFLSAFSSHLFMDIGAVDFAGCGVVHMVGGVAAFIGAAVLGPRAGRYDPVTKEILDPMPGHNSALVVLGTFLLWFGWYGFNPGSTLTIGAAHVAGKSAVTTTLAAAAGGITNVIIYRFVEGIISLEEACNGVLAGLVGITSACSVVEPWAALLCGAGGSVFYFLGDMVLRKCRIDDPCKASCVHFFAGVWGLMAPALFAEEVNMANAYSTTGNAKVGIFYGGDGSMIVVQALTVAFVVAWTTATMLPFFVLLKTAGIFRVSMDVEEAGMDASEHGGAAYSKK